MTADTNKPPQTKAEAIAEALQAASTNIAPRISTGMSLQTDTGEGKIATGDIDPNVNLSTLTREQLEARVKLLTDNLIAANANSEYFRKQWQDLKLEDAALGKDALTLDQRKLEESKVEAYRELYQTEMRRREAVVLLGKLLDTSLALIQSAPKFDPQVRADYEVASRAAKEYLAGYSGAAMPIGTSLADGKISDINPKLNAVIINLGKTQGVKEGMPFIIYQDAQQVGMAKIVLARPLVSAALVESLKPNITLKVGDRVVVSTQ